jgi:porin
LVEELRRIVDEPKKDAKELCRRICFNALISNTDIIRAITRLSPRCCCRLTATAVHAHHLLRRSSKPPDGEDVGGLRRGGRSVHLHLVHQLVQLLAFTLGELVALLLGEPPIANGAKRAVGVDDPANTFTAGTVVPQYTGLVLPDPMQPNSFLPSEYFLVQALSKQASVVVGKISDVFIPDQTAFGNTFKNQFANFNFNKNPITTNFYNPTALGALGVWAFSPTFVVVGGVLDPYTKADRVAEPNSFEKVNIYLTSIMSYDIGGLPGQFSPAYNWSNKPKINLESPFGRLTSVAATTQAIGSLLGLAPGDGLPTNLKDDSWFVLANVSQYLFVKDDPETVARKQKSGEPIRGIGVFARAGYAPDETNPITRDASVALFAHGLLAHRDYDSFGIGFYYNKISDKLKTGITALSHGQATARDESGMEVFYNFAITPAVRVIPSYQHIWHPLAAEVAERRQSTDIFQTRVTVAW